VEQASDQQTTYRWLRNLTLILIDVPVLTVQMKSEARRFVTLLDALYESGCMLLIRAAAPPDDLFFPETQNRSSVTSNSDTGNDLVYQEMYSEVYQDSTSPFRPNISSSYAGDVLSGGTPKYAANTSPLSADEDVDFGPVYGTGRGVGEAPDERHQQDRVTRGTSPDFTQVYSALVGEDERIAYKRAKSRLYEMCGDRWWSRENFWKPANVDKRHWKRVRQSIPAHSGASTGAESSFQHGASPFRIAQDPPPTFNFSHFWRMVTWGKMAGAWGRGELKEDRVIRPPHEAESR
jgi:protein AFG1